MSNRVRVMPFVRNIARRTLPSRAYQAIANHVVHPYRSWRRHWVFSLPSVFFGRWQYPKVLSIFLTTRCNLRCFICRRESVPGTDLNYENLRKLREIGRAHV
jgi:hypothetical protein